MAHKTFFTGKRLSDRQRKMLVESLRVLSGPDADTAVAKATACGSLPKISPHFVDLITKDFFFAEKNLKSQDPVMWSLYLDEMNNAESFMREVNSARKNRVSKSFQPADGFIAFHFDD